MNKVALVAGASGLAGRAMIERLLAEGDWQVYGLARRPDHSQFPGQVTWISADLYDSASLTDVANLGITHLFYAAQNAGSQDGPGAMPDTHWRLSLFNAGLQVSRAAWPMIQRLVPPRFYEGFLAERARIHCVEENLAMFANVLTAVTTHSAFERVVLVTGGRYYGHHLGWYSPTYAQPFIEDMPRSPGPNWYYAVEDHLAQQAQGKTWHWTVLRPSLLLGYGTSSPFNAVTSMAAYACLLKEMGEPLWFPGNRLAYHCQQDFTSTSLLADMALWAVSSEHSRNQAFNATATHAGSWQQVWPKLAQQFEMELPDPYHNRCAGQMMRAAEFVWPHMVNKHALDRPNLDDLLCTNYLTALTNGVQWDSLYCDQKLKQAGYTRETDSVSLFMDEIAALQSNKIVPSY